MNSDLQVRPARSRPGAVDFFCGVGGMSLGLAAAGFDLLGAVDHDERVVRAYNANFGDGHAVTADLAACTISELRASLNLPETIDLVAGGPPCQGFSLMGSRVEDDDRNLLLYRFAELAVQLKPRAVLIENVPGALMGDHIKWLSSALGILADGGYRIHGPRIIDAASLGVPQRRRRLFVVATRSDVHTFSFPRATHVLLASENGGSLPLAPSASEAIGDIPDLAAIDALYSRDTHELPLSEDCGGYTRLLRSADFFGVAPASPQRNRVMSGLKLSRHSEAVRERFEHTPPGDTEQVSHFHRLHPDEPANTIRAGTGPERGSYMAPRPIHYREPRCITVREAARLQSFPDWFQFHPTNWHGFRQVGNAVPPLVAKALGDACRQSLEEDDQAHT